MVVPSPFVFGWPNGTNWLKAPPAFSLSPLVPVCAGDMLNQVALELGCAPVVLDHWLVNKGGLEAVERGRKPFRVPAVGVEHTFPASNNGRSPSTERRCGQGLV
jgi:hypothetical protein